MAFDMCSHCFFKEISYIMEIPSKIYLCAGLFSTGKIFIEVCVIIQLNLKRPQISAHKVDSFVLAAVCVRQKQHTDKLSQSQQSIYLYLPDTTNPSRRVLRGVFIASKRQETHSRRNTGSRVRKLSGHHIVLNIADTRHTTGTCIMFSLVLGAFLYIYILSI